MPEYTDEQYLQAYLWMRYGDCTNPEGCICQGKKGGGAAEVLECPYFQSWRCSTYKELADKQREVERVRRGG